MKLNIIPLPTRSNHCIPLYAHCALVKRKILTRLLTSNKTIDEGSIDEESTDEESTDEKLLDLDGHSTVKGYAFYQLSNSIDQFLYLKQLDIIRHTIAGIFEFDSLIDHCCEALTEINYRLYNRKFRANYGQKEFDLKRGLFRYDSNNTQVVLRILVKKLTVKEGASSYKTLFYIKEKYPNLKEISMNTNKDLHGYFLHFVPLPDRRLFDSSIFYSTLATLVKFFTYLDQTTFYDVKNNNYDYSQTQQMHY